VQLLINNLYRVAVLPITYRVIKIFYVRVSVAFYLYYTIAMIEKRERADTWQHLQSLRMEAGKALNIAS